MKIYENIVIGNFLYLLGIQAGKRAAAGEQVVGSVNLLQQTPLDRSVADVLVEYPGAVRILEFKRLGNTDTKEEVKRKGLLACLQSDEAMMALSPKIHWYVQSASSAGAIDIRVAPYLHFDRGTDATSLVALAESVAASGDHADQIPIADCLRYLQVLRSANDINGTSRGGSGAIVIVVSRGGRVHHVVLEKLTDFYATHRQIYDAQMEDLKAENEIVSQPRRSPSGSNPQP